VEIQSYAGLAPVTERSGQSTWVHWRYAAPTFLRQTFVEWAGETIPRSFWAKTYYQQQRAKGASHQAPLRALAFKWIRILYRCWQNQTPYHESRYLNMLQQRGSPLLKHIADIA
jgi:Transposase IS116/IS110/IS902 family